MSEILNTATKIAKVIRCDPDWQVEVRQGHTSGYKERIVPVRGNNHRSGKLH